jgi:hypothetical protein
MNYLNMFCIILINNYFSNLIASTILPQASSNTSTDVAYEILKKPTRPNAAPGTQATFA